MPTPTDVWNVENGQIGFQSGSGANKFNTWYNNKAGNIGNYAWAWCQAFQSWCFDTAGVEYPLTAHCQTALNWWRNKGQFDRSPRIGDQVFYDWGDGGQADHVGFVANLDSNCIYTIEGNTGSWPGEVATRSHPRTSGYILGYGHPNYDGVATPSTPSAPSQEPATSSGQIVTTKVSGLNWRVGPSTSAQSLASYGTGAEVECVGWVYGQDPYGTGENRWVKSAARGLYAWVGGIYSIGNLGNLNEATAQQPVAVQDPVQDFWITCKQATIWRNGPSTNDGVFAQYGPGAQVLCSEKVQGQDPYGTGQNWWYKSSLNGKYCWQGTIE